MKYTLSDRSFTIINQTFIMVVVAMITYPLLFVTSASISDPFAVSSGKMWIWPVDITFEGFARVFADDAIWLGYRNTIMYTLIGTCLHLVVLLPCAYALSRKELMAKTFLVWFILFTMLFNGGLIPSYLLIKSLGMLDTVWALVIPGAVGAWSILVARTFFKQNIPDELVEAAKIDGASDFYVFFKIVIPLSAPIIAVMALFHAVGLWNQYFSALIYLSDRSMFPLQLILRKILIINEVSTGGTLGAGEADSIAQQVRTASLIKYAVMIVSTLPLLMVYPFLQRFFVKGVLIGSVKE